MKKLFVFATAALLVTGTAFASKGDKKCCGKSACSKDKKEATAKKEVKEVKEVKKKA